VDARHACRGRGIDSADNSVGEGTAYKSRVKKSGKLQIVEKTSAAS
jgi:hypothetical protein